MKYFYVLASMMIIHFALIRFDRKEVQKPAAMENTKKNACSSQAFDHFLRFFRFYSAINRDLSQRKQRNPLRIPIRGHTRQSAHINRRSFDELRPDKTRVT